MVAGAFSKTDSSLPALDADTTLPPPLSSKLSTTVPSQTTRNLSTTKICSTNALNYDNMNQTIKEVSYAVRGPIVARALEIENDLKKVSIKRGKLQKF